MDIPTVFVMNSVYCEGGYSILGFPVEDMKKFNARKEFRRISDLVDDNDIPKEWTLLDICMSIQTGPHTTYKCSGSNTDDLLYSLSSGRVASIVPVLPPYTVSASFSIFDGD